MKVINKLRNTIAFVLQVIIACFILTACGDDGVVTTFYLDGVDSDYENGVVENQSQTEIIYDCVDRIQLHNSDLYGNMLGEEFYFHRNLLNETEQIAYDELYMGMSQCAEYTDLTVTITENQLNTIRDAIINDHPELIWIGMDFEYWVDNQGFVLSVEENHSDLSEKYMDFYNHALTICTNAIKYEQKVDQVKYVHDYLCDFNTYDVEAPYNQVAYSAIVEGKTVCAGYARAFQYCMQLLGIPATVVYGETDEEHSWNLVQLDGEYYNVDVTWDDSNLNSGEYCYDYFNVTDEEISESHTRKNLSVYLPEAKGTL